MKDNMGASQRHSRLLFTQIETESRLRKDEVQATQRFSRLLSNYVDRYRKSKRKKGRLLGLNCDAYTDAGI
jgi:hypothetical protein